MVRSLIKDTTVISLTRKNDLIWPLTDFGFYVNVILIHQFPFNLVYILFNCSCILAIYNYHISVVYALTVHILCLFYDVPYIVLICVLTFNLNIRTITYVRIISIAYSYCVVDAMDACVWMDLTHHPHNLRTHLRTVYHT